MGYVVEQGATTLCVHSGQAQPTVVSPRVSLGRKSAVTVAAPWTISGCPLPTNAGGPCVTASWTRGSVRVRAQGQPLVIQDGTATCVPTGVPLTVVVSQIRVTAT